MDTAGSKIHLNFSFRLQVLRIELNLMILLLSFGLHKQWIAEILVMKMKRRFIVPISIGLHDLTVGDLGVFHQDVDVRAALSVRITDEAFDRESMVSFVRRRDNRRESAQPYCAQHGGNNTPPQLNPHCLVAPHVCDVAAFLSVSSRHLPHTTDQPACAGFPDFEADPFSTGPLVCQREQRGTLGENGSLSNDLEIEGRSIQDFPGMEDATTISPKCFGLCVEDGQQR